MRIIFSSFVLFTSSLSLTPRELAAYDEKLRAYQNMTGINDFTFNEIWESGITNRKTSLCFFRVKIIFFSSKSALWKGLARFFNKTWATTIENGSIWIYKRFQRPCKPSSFRSWVSQFGHAVKSRNFHHWRSGILSDCNQILHHGR